MVRKFFLRLKQIHMIGIGGTGMNGIAEVLLNLGYAVSGSDLQATEVTRRLEKLGARVAIGHDPKNLSGADVVVISSAVRDTNPELVEARRLKIPVIPRAEMLSELMRMKLGIAVAGSHGKTSTTSMIALVLEAGGFDPTVIVGGRLNTIGAHAKLGGGDFIVAEADESDRSFLFLSPFIAVLTNIDEEHLDQYQTVDELKKTFVHFANKVPFYSPIVLCLDSPPLQGLIPLLERRIISYGFSAQADFFARDQKFENFSSSSTVYQRGEPLGTLRLNVPGKHNIANALAAIAVGLELDIPQPRIFQALESYSGTGRRFELKKVVNDIMIIEDYAHHPTEIKATLDAAKTGWPRRVLTVFQPHRYSRLSFLMKKFATAFNQSDVLILTEVYSAGEDQVPGVSGQALFEEVSQFGHRDVHFEPDLARIPGLVASLAQPQDIIMIMGAGNINRIVPDVISALEEKK